MTAGVLGFFTLASFGSQLAVGLPERVGIAPHAEAPRANLEGQVRRSIERQRRTVMANPLRASLVTLWRVWTKRTPHAKPLAEQPEAAAGVRYLRRGA